MAQVHAPSKSHPQRKKIPKVATTRSKQILALANLLIRLDPPHTKLLKLASNCASWASAAAHGKAGHGQVDLRRRRPSKEVINATSLDLVVANASAGFGPAASSAIPEPSTWAMLALGFLGLGGPGLKGRRRAAPS
jgi:hypothetical protein